MGSRDKFARGENSWIMVNVEWVVRNRNVKNCKVTDRRRERGINIE